MSHASDDVPASAKWWPGTQTTPEGERAGEDIRRMVAGEFPEAGAVQVVMTRNQLIVYERWLAQRQRELFPIPARDDDLPTYGVRFIIRGERP